MDLSSLLTGQPLLILKRETPGGTKRTKEATSKSVDTLEGKVQRVKEIRSQSHQSWLNIRKAARGL